jgi:hypothetical protein
LVDRLNDVVRHLALPLPTANSQLGQPSTASLETDNRQSEIGNRQSLAVYLFNTICYHAGAMHQTGWAVAAVAQLGYGRGKSEH